MARPPKVLVLGLDACDNGIVSQLAADGRAPAIAQLLDRAARVATSPPTGLYEGALWPSLFTAMSPTKHGYYCHEELEIGTYEHRATSVREIGAPPFWATLSRAGRRVAVIDVPHSAVSGPLNGIQIVEWGCHDRHVGFSTWPPSIADEIEGRFGLHPIAGIDAGSDRQFAPCDVAHRDCGPRRTPEEVRALFADLVAAVDTKTELSLHYLDQDDWDLFVTVLGEGHCTGHQFWFLHDREDPAHDPELAAELGDPVALMYARLDRAVAAHLERAGPDTAVFVLMSHGMGRMNSGVFVIDAVLRRLADADAAGARGRPLARGLKGIWYGLPLEARRRLAPTMARVIRSRLRNAPDGLTPYHDVFERCPGCSAELAPDEGRPWFVIPNNTVCGGIRINRAGRERHGTVTAADFDRVCDELAEDLLDIIKIETGEPLVRAVMRSSDHYDRNEPDPFPDLLVEWDRRSPTKTVYSPKIGVVHEPYEHWRTGDHFPAGLLLASGPGIVPRNELPAIPVTDIAPTICARLGVELPGVDGVPVPELSAPVLTELVQEGDR
jgi:predicted AlkP superfamily phosphohydrolase/phosphomutase